MQAPDTQYTRAFDCTSNVGVLVDKVSSALTYVCRSIPGTLSSDPYWQIFRVTKTAGITRIQWPMDDSGKGNFEYNLVADDRATYSYF